MSEPWRARPKLSALKLRVCRDSVRGRGEGGTRVLEERFTVLLGGYRLEEGALGGCDEGERGGESSSVFVPRRE